MKTKTQKQEEIKKAAGFFTGSKSLVFTDVTGVPAEDLRRLRREMRAVGADTLVIKKRLMNVMLKEKAVDYDVRQFKSSVATVFSKENIESISGPVYTFFNTLGGTEKEAKAAAIKKILGAYDLTAKASVDAATILMIGKLPAREVLLAQLLGMLASPIRSFLYLLQQKSEQTSSQ